MKRIGTSDLQVHPLALGGNVFGWTADRDSSIAVLDACADAGGNFLDTADSYSAWAPGHSGGGSEAIIGGWTAARGIRDRIVVATCRTSPSSASPKPSRSPTPTGWPDRSPSSRTTTSCTGRTSRDRSPTSSRARDSRWSPTTPSPGFLTGQYRTKGPRPHVAVPIASARTVEQLPALLAVAD